MSYHTKIVGTSPEGVEDGDRVFAGLRRYLDGHDRAAGFDRVTQDHGYASSAGHGTTFVGAVNHLDEDRFFTILREAAQNPAWYTDFAPLAVILRGDDADHMPRTRTLDADGHWHGA